MPSEPQKQDVQEERIRSTLVVDDVKLYREILRRWMTGEHYRCDVADGGRTAWELFCKWQPDIVITDIDMKSGNGFELIANIRRYDVEHNSVTKIVVMSSLKDDEIEAFIQDAGADGFVEKPLSKQGVMAILHQFEAELETPIAADRESPGTSRSCPPTGERSDVADNSNRIFAPHLVSPSLRRMFQSTKLPRKPGR